MTKGEWESGRGESGNRQRRLLTTAAAAGKAVEAAAAAKSGSSIYLSDDRWFKGRKVDFCSEYRRSHLAISKGERD